MHNSKETKPEACPFCGAEPMEDWSGAGKRTYKCPRGHTSWMHLDKWNTRILDTAQHDIENLLDSVNTAEARVGQLIKNNEELEDTADALAETNMGLRSKLDMANSRKFIRDTEVSRMFQEILDHLSPQEQEDGT